jgi:hypothetical protein
MNLYIIQESYDVVNIGWLLKTYPDLDFIILGVLPGTIGIIAENLPTTYIKLRNKNKYKRVKITNEGEVKSVFLKKKVWYYYVPNKSSFFEFSFKNYVGEISGGCIVLNPNSRLDLTYFYKFILNLENG